MSFQTGQQTYSDPATSGEGADPALPNYRRPELRAALKDLELMSDLLGGTPRMWQRASVYINKWPDEDDDTYQMRRKLEEVFGGLTRTLSASIGMLFAKNPVLTYGAQDALLETHWQNLDGRGTEGDVLMKRFARTALRDGLGVIVVDHPPAPKDVVVTAGNELELGLRPKWALYSRRCVLSWLEELVEGQMTLTQLVLYEPSDERDGAYGVLPVQRFRRLYIENGVAKWALLRILKGKTGLAASDFVVESAGVFINRIGQTAKQLPIGIAYTGETEATLTATIPLLDVAYTNLSHWRISTDVRWYLSLAAYPQPVVVGDLANQVGVDQNGAQTMIPGKLAVGPGVVVHVQVGGKFEWAELSGTSIAAQQAAADTKLHAMAKLGMSFLMKDIRGVETAESKRLDSTAENASLVTASIGVESAVNAAWKWHAWFLGIAPEQAPGYTLNRDFDSTTLDAQTMLAYVTAVQNAGLPMRILLEAWQTGGRISPDADLDEIEAAVVAAQLAKEEQDRIDAQTKLEALTRGQPPTDKAPPAPTPPPAGAP